MIHDARIVPLDGRPHVGQNIRQWFGDSRGRWEGNTLVVDTTNFTDKANYRGSTEGLHLIERFTRVDADTVKYEFTIDDPTTFTKKWTAAIPMARTDEQIYEYACHEGNYGMVNLLKGARVQEKAGERNSRWVPGSGSSSGSGSRFSVLAVLTTVVVPTFRSAVAQGSAGAKPVARPNFDGIWNSATATPLERPAQLKDKAFFTPEEAAAWEQQVTGRNQAEPEPEPEPTTRSSASSARAPSRRSGRRSSPTLPMDAFRRSRRRLPK